jgi:oxygen-independent coproporphyrinogen-3 oxidase
MADMVRSGAVVLADESLVVELYETLGRELGRHGFARYEISNWARQGWESRHNLTYWGRGEYLGLGAGASSYRRGERYRRIEEPGAYVDAALSGGDPVSFRETLSREDALAEEVMLSLRTERGLDLDRLAREYGSDLAEVESLLEHFRTEGLIVRNRKEVRLSAKGILVSDAIIEDLASVLAVS